MPCTIRDVLKVVRLLQLPVPKFATFPSCLAGTVFRGVPQSPSRIHQMSKRSLVSLPLGEKGVGRPESCGLP